MGLWKKTPSKPTPPTNVKLILRDGTEIPVDTAYKGFDGESHVWEVINRRGDIQGATIERLPPATSVIFSLRVDG